LRHLLFELRIRHLDDDGAGTDLRARSEDDALDTAGGRGRNPPNVFRHQAARAAHRAGEGAPLDGVDPDRAARDLWRCGLELGHEHRDHDDRGDAGHGIRRLAHALLLENRWIALDIYHVVSVVVLKWLTPAGWSPDRKRGAVLSL